MLHVNLDIVLFMFMFMLSLLFVIFLSGSESVQLVFFYLFISIFSLEIPVIMRGKVGISLTGFTLVKFCPEAKTWTSIKHT